MLLYIEAPTQLADGTLVARERGLHKGGVALPLLGNMFLHYAFDEWMRRNHAVVPFECYADDIIVHCRSLKEW